jgi:hypothetical protein
MVTLRGLYNSFRNPATVSRERIVGIPRMKSHRSKITTPLLPLPFSGKVVLH